jgi:hypothetical protein
MFIGLEMVGDCREDLGEMMSFLRICGVYTDCLKGEPD